MHVYFVMNVYYYSFFLETFSVSFALPIHRRITSYRQAEGMTVCVQENNLLYCFSTSPGYYSLLRYSTHRGEY
jgi:hypothetical protein